jgi:Inovirus Coat protein B
MKMKRFKIAAKYCSTALSLLAAQHASAAAVDVTALVTDIGSQVAPVVLVGGAILLVLIAVKAFKWIRAAMS